MDIDHCLRKEVTLDCITPSNNAPIPPGISHDINQTVKMVKPFPDMFGAELESIKATRKQYRKEFRNLKLLDSQILTDSKFISQQMKETKKEKKIPQENPRD